MVKQHVLLLVVCRYSAAVLFATQRRTSPVDESARCVNRVRLGEVRNDTLACDSENTHEFSPLSHKAVEAPKPAEKNEGPVLEASGYQLLWRSKLDASPSGGMRAGTTRVAARLCHL